MSVTKRDRISRAVSGTSLPPASFAEEVAHALRREYGGTHAAVKTVVALVGANERAVKNWFDARNAPSGEFLVGLCRHSDEVFAAILRRAGRREHLRAKRVFDLADKLRELVKALDETS